LDLASVVPEFLIRCGCNPEQCPEFRWLRTQAIFELGIEDHSLAATPFKARGRPVSQTATEKKQAFDRLHHDTHPGTMSRKVVKLAGVTP
jgi:hypothetical protein